MSRSNQRKIILSKDAEKFFKKLKDNDLEDRLEKAISALSSNPFPPGIENISLKTYRIRIGDYRVIYQITETHIIVNKIGHRREIYRRLGFL